MQFFRVGSSRVLTELLAKTKILTHYFGYKMQRSLQILADIDEHQEKIYTGRILLQTSFAKTFYPPFAAEVKRRLQIVDKLNDLALLWAGSQTVHLVLFVSQRLWDGYYAFSPSIKLNLNLQKLRFSRIFEVHYQV